MMNTNIYDNNNNTAYMIIIFPLILENVRRANVLQRIMSIEKGKFFDLIRYAFSCIHVKLHLGDKFYYL